MLNVETKCNCIRLQRICRRFLHRRFMMILLVVCHLALLLIVHTRVIFEVLHLIHRWSLAMLRYSSLSKQQEICFPSCSWCIFSDLVCRFLLPLLNMDIDYGSICDGDDNVAFWSNLERIYAQSEGDFMLVNPKQNHACGKACVIFGAILPTLCSVAEIASSLDMIFIELFRESSVTQK
ncbi:unnamed protein product [Arabidopsis halleri]